MPFTGRIVSVPSSITQPFAGKALQPSFALTQPADVRPSQRSRHPAAFSSAESVFAPVGAGFIFGVTITVSQTPRA